MPTPAKRGGNTVARVITRDNLIAEYTKILESIPEAQDDDGVGFILDVLNAETVDDLNREDSLPSLDSLAPCRLKFLDVVRRPSDLENGMPFYLVVDAMDTRTGEAIRFQTSAGTPMAVIASRWQRGQWPFVASFTKKAEATKGGYHPLQVKVEVLNDKDERPIRKATAK